MNQPQPPTPSPKASATAVAVGTKQSVGAYTFVKPLLETRAELLATFVIDGALVTVAAFARALFLWLLHMVVDEKSGGPIFLLEFILDYGLLGTALVITLFDLAKRIRSAYRDFNE